MILENSPLGGAIFGEFLGILREVVHLVVVLIGIINEFFYSNNIFLSILHWSPLMILLR